MASSWTLPRSLPPSMRMVTRWPEADQRDLIEQHPAVEVKSDEWHKCNVDCAYFIHNHVEIMNATNEQWEPFALWPEQRTILQRMESDFLLAILKARQLGLTWLALARALWMMLFRPIATIGIFSQRETDAAELLSKRLAPMYDRLPEWVKVGAPRVNNSTHIELPNDSSARAFPTTGGRSYTFSLLIIDEADFQPDLPGLLNAVKPTIDAGGRMWLISTVDKSQPMSRFKAIYRAATESANAYASIFLPWQARPGRTPEWYEAQKADALANTGSLDDLHQEYPATDVEALAPRSLDKRIPHEWLHACYARRPALTLPTAPALPSLVVWAQPTRGRRYVIGADPAEGNPTSDESALCVLDKITGAQVAELAGRFDPSVLAGYAHQLGHWYNRAEIVPERNNHGHAFIAWFAQNSHLPVMAGPDNKPGWNSNSLGKTLMYDRAADTFRDAARDGLILLHGQETYLQLASIEGATLLAPEGMRDDRADAWTLANAGRLQPQPAAAFAQGSAKGWNP